jgi:thiamine-phosphate pyrophosphorylase
MTDSVRLADPLDAVERIPPGWGLVLRHYDAPDRASLAAATVQAGHARGIVVLIGADPDLARRTGADGVHIPEGLAASGRILINDLRHLALVSAAAHGAAGLRTAARLGADIVMLSPVHATKSHPTATPLGRMRFAALAQSSAAPVIALGGINLADHETLRALGAHGLAGIGFLEALE